MTLKFSSKEIHFLKTDSEGPKIKPPEKYFGDLLLEKTKALKVFEKKLSVTKIPGGKFLCALIQISLSSDSILDKTKDTFKNVFNSFFDHKKGI